MAEFTEGTETFLFTDIEGSTRLWDAHPEAMRRALPLHDLVLRSAIEGHDGVIFSTGGDGFAAAFRIASDALAAALDAQLGLAGEAWPPDTVLRVRMGIHTGQAELRGGDYFGAEVNRAARLMAIAHGGQVVASGATAEAVDGGVPGGASLVDLGEHRLRDLSEPIRVFQVSHPGLEERFAPLRSLEAYRTNLVPQRTSFIGREVEVDTLLAALKTSRLVTLTGVGGVGKTRLAVQAAAELLSNFPDGVQLIELAPVRDPEQVVSAVAEHVTDSAAPGHSEVERIIGSLRRRRVLLVLDNCEHVLDAVAEMADALLDGCPEVAILATSREGLGIEGERIIAVRSLAVPAADAELKVVSDSLAVRLFVDRARAVVSGFMLDETNADSIVEICRRLDGVPLAIELAAARVRSLSPAQVAERLDERFSLLTGGGRSRVERHQTLRATIDWSYELLDEGDRAALRQLAVFRGGASLDAAEAVLGGAELSSDQVLDAITSLVDKSLVLSEHEAGRVRYRLLETIREYAEEQLEHLGVLASTRDRHAAHFVALVNAAVVGLKGPDDAAAISSITQEFDNVFSAIIWAGSRGELELAFELVIGLFPLAGSGQARGLVALAEATAQLEGVGTSEARVSFLATLFALRASVANDRVRARALLEHLVPLIESWPVELDAITLSHLSIGYFALGSFEEAIDSSRRSAELARQEGSDFEQASAYVTLAVSLLMSGSPAEAETATGEMLAAARRVGSTTVLGSTLMIAGWVQFDRDPSRALELLDESLSLPGAEPTASWLVWSHVRAGALRARRGDWSVAADHFARARDALSGLANLTSNAALYSYLAEAMASAGDLVVAARLLGATDRINPYWGTRGAALGAPLSRRLLERLGEADFAALLAEGAELDDRHAMAMAHDAIAALPSS